MIVSEWPYNGVLCAFFIKPSCIICEGIKYRFILDFKLNKPDKFSIVLTERIKIEYNFQIYRGKSDRRKTELNCNKNINTDSQNNQFKNPENIWKSKHENWDKKIKRYRNQFEYINFHSEEKWTKFLS